MNTWPPAFVCGRPDCGKLTVPIRVLPSICPHCHQPAQWQQFELSKADQRFLKATKIDPEPPEPVPIIARDPDDAA